MNQNDIPTSIFRFEGKEQYFRSQSSNQPAPTFNPLSNRGKNLPITESWERFSFYFAVSLSLGSFTNRRERHNSSGLFNFTNMREFAKKCFREKGKDVKHFGREKLVGLGILQNPSIFGSTIGDIVELDGKDEKVPEFLQFTLRKY